MEILYVGAFWESVSQPIRLFNEVCELGNHYVTILVNDQSKSSTYYVDTIIPHKNIRIIETDYVKPDMEYVNHIFNYPFDILLGCHVEILDMLRSIRYRLRIPTGVIILDIPTDLIENNKERKDNWDVYFPLLKEMDFFIFNTTIAAEEFTKKTGIAIPEKNIITYPITPVKKYRGANAGGDYVISCFRFAKSKNGILIPKALAVTPIKKYVAIGRDAGELDDVRSLCEKHNIEFIHKENITEEEKYELIAGSAFMIYPQNTPYIGGLAPWEAIYTGTPVFVPDLKVHHDLFKDLPIFFENDNPNDLAMKINTVTKKVTDADITYVEQEASFSTMAKKVLNILEEATNDKTDRH